MVFMPSFNSFLSYIAGYLSCDFVVVTGLLAPATSPSPPPPHGSSSSVAPGHESSYTWEGVNPAACDEILWGVLTLNRAMQEGDDLEPVNVSLKV